MNVLRGSEPRKTRFHDLSGEFIGLRAVATDGPRALAGAIARRVFGRYPELPWIPFPVIRRFETIARPDWRVLEMGSGMSTIWWARRVASVTAIENDPMWFERVVNVLRARGLITACVELREADDHYADLSMFADETFDLVVLDGHARDELVPQAFRVAKRPGYVYLDDADKAARWREHWGESVERLEAEARRVGADLEHHVGLKPATMVACSGLLVSLGVTPRHPPARRRRR